MKKYNIVLKENKTFILAQCEDLNFAEKYLKEMEENDKKLQKYYNWSKLPEYEIVENDDYKNMKDKIKEYLKENIEETKEIVMKICDYDGNFQNLYVFDNNENFFKENFNSTMEILKSVLYGNYNVNDDYVVIEYDGTLTTYNDYTYDLYYDKLKENIDYIIDYIEYSEELSYILDEIIEKIGGIQN